MKASVSVITVTQRSRQDTLPIVLECLSDQSYPVLEWVIVEGSKTEDDREANGPFIHALTSRVPINYVVPPPGTRLGQLRNIGYSACKGDIIVVFDDDDYVMKTRVEHSVKMLKGKYLIAGCSVKYMYDYNLEKLVKFKSFGDNHSTNDCFAFKKEYLLTNRHDPFADFAEESSFTKNFSNPMAQLDPNLCIVSSSHGSNTFDKKEIVIKSHLLVQPGNPSAGYMYPQADHTDKQITNLMPEETFLRLKRILNPPKPSPCDIAYYTGGTSIEWEPENQSLGGSEQAVVHLSTEWVKLGKSVIVYGNFLKNTLYQGVAYKSWKEFDWGVMHDTVILWRPSGVNCSLQFAIKAKKILFDVHDPVQYFRFDFAKYAHKIDLVMLKSKFHVSAFEDQLGPMNHVVIPNGVRLKQFAEKPDGVVRNPYRFCYCSCYTRGLEDLLKYVWPVIFQAEPRSELHVYHGMDNIQDPQLRQKLTFLMGQPGVMDRGRRDVETIRREKWESTFHLYLTMTDEIDCISIRESVAAGCIPIISRKSVYAEREGVHINIDGSPGQFQKAAHGIVQLMKTPGLQSLLKIKPEIMSWEKVAKEWLSEI
jgi:glycosyltransferase involved in cell wall biosynthesis